MTSGGRRRAPKVATMSDHLGSPILAIRGENPARVDAWLTGLARVRGNDGHSVVRVSSGPEEARTSRARKTLVADMLDSAVDGCLAGDHETMYIVDLTNAYGHTGRGDDEASAAMGHSVMEAVRAARQVDGLPLVIVVDDLHDLPDSLRAFETIVTGSNPHDETTLRFGSPPPQPFPRPGEAPDGHVWAARSTDRRWSPAPAG